MEIIMKTLDNFEGYIILALIAVAVILIIMLVIMIQSLNKLENKYRKLMRGVNNKNLEELVIGYLDRIDRSDEEVKNIKQLYENLDVRLKSCLQRVSMVRYRAFEDVGSDLSFSIAMLDENNDGVIITGIYGRNESTTYAKPIDRGISRYDLSEEEKQVLKDCVTRSVN